MHPSVSLADGNTSSTTASVIDEHERCRDLYRDVVSTDAGESGAQALVSSSASAAVTSAPRCPPVWDSIHCWPPVEAGKMLTLPCREVFGRLNYTQHDVRWGAEAHRECGSNGTWLHGNWTNYTECLELLPQSGPSSIPAIASYILLVFSLVSLVALCVTLFIFTYFKSLQCSRLRVHKNLVASLIVHSILLAVISFPNVLGPHWTTYSDVDWLCKSVLSLKLYAAMASINWMFVEGLLLHSRIAVSVFQQDAPFKLYYLIGWGLPALCVLAWSFVMESRMRSHCWRGYGNSVFVWIISGPMMVALLVNTVFLVNIIRILLTKLQSNTSIETMQLRKVSKATALLFPLLGITHLFFCINPRDDAHFESAYVICNALLQSSQGLSVSILYCFVNSEVQTAVRNAYMQAMIRRNPNRYSRGRGLSQSYSTYCEASSLAPDLHPHIVGHKVAPMRKALGPARRYSEVEVETLASIVAPSHAQPTIKWERNCYF
ncbi:corticotropin-releasing factor receptor 1-like [Rhipicephalus microplus]|uniref:corticotropin-releasing factor receptor 1-like n=1 Tax=Rhipicephalus microplus TaxID=6941 RepID=UPI003F6B8B66